MTKFKTSKASQFRTWGLFLMLGGMFTMILGTAGVLWMGENGRIFLFIFLILGIILSLGSTAIYAFAGVLSTSAVTLHCPECGKKTQILGTSDRCMYCKTMLTLDPSMATNGDEKQKDM
ncbi:DUF2614 family zinc ribbon-containing protein [Longirhabdus pacifica]|uniref:DUF2614 family zinc ribbon-containing protein n=1 Tax=Longirhabdus pacifica TaxID=2305227 RepID=UPI001008D840|nr:DUF2614 family zinc ribbon-containing protein [Longirhabdus pacifica]